jgi:uncharacterized protein YegP (UPF0339 family)
MLHDDYLSCGQYENQPSHVKSKDFSAFVDVKSGKHFFALVDQAGNVMFRSEGYDTEKARDNGIESVVKNMPVAGRYAVAQENGQWLVSLKAANHKEIARTCPCASEAEAKALVARLSSAKWSAAPKSAPKAATTVKKEVKAAAPKSAPVAKKEVKAAAPKSAPVAKKEVKTVAPKSASVAKKEATVVTTSTVAKVVKPTESKVVKTTTAKAAPVKTTTKVEMPKVVVTTTKGTTVKTSKSVATESGYGACGFYLGHPTLQFGQVQTGYTKFTSGGQFYFAVYNPDGSVYLGSVAYATEQKRDEVFVSVVQNIENADCYRVSELSNQFHAILCDVQGNELARSCGFGSFTEAFKTTPNGRVRSEVNLY